MRLQANRRKFIETSIGTGAFLSLSGSAPAYLRAAAHVGSSENILVVIQLSGGNDGLNTVIPTGDEEYYAARPKLAIPKQDALHAGSQDLAFHPSLRGFSELIQNGDACVIHGVGYENPNRSHFESMDIWHTCLRKDQARQQGWLGQFLERLDVGESGGDLPAIHFGDKKQPLALASREVRVPSVSSVDEFRLKSSRADDLSELIQAMAPSTKEESNELLSFVKSSTSSALKASERVTAATKDYSPESSYPESQLAQQLSVVAQLIDAELATRVYYVELDGFDTHAQQPDAHASLLREWSDALSAFVSDLRGHGHLNRVSILTFSEFGRRVRENASLGTDHGAAAPVFLAGGGLANTILGSQPSLTDLQDGDLKYTVDFREVYGAILSGWLRVENAGSITGLPSSLEIYKAQA